MITIHRNSLNIMEDSLEKKIHWALAALEEISNYLSRGIKPLDLDSDERSQIISALAYTRSQRRPEIVDASQQYRDWVDAEFDLDLVLTHLRTLRPRP